MTDDPKKIAKGLTSAQVRALEEIASLAGNYQCVLNYRPPQALENKGLSNMTHVKNGHAFYVVLPLGLAVLAALNSEQTQ